MVDCGEIGVWASCMCCGRGAWLVDRKKVGV